MFTAEGYSTKIIADSIGPSGKRLTTWELCYPRFVHAELMTHRLFSRNAASSRAIPIQKMLQRVQDGPAMPVWWGKNQAGMQANEELDDVAKNEAKWEWLAARDTAVRHVRVLQDKGLHKQVANRVVEPWMFITVILTSTEFENWFGLRDHKDAQPELAWVAKDMHEKFDDSRPLVLQAGQWHLPYIFEEDRAFAEMMVRNSIENCYDNLLCEISTGRCARVSYLTHDGKRDWDEDVTLHNKLRASGHWSPFEHACQAMTKEAWQKLSLIHI